MRLFTLFIFFALAQAPAQVLTASKILNASGQDTASAVAVDRQGNIFVAGTTTASDFPIVNGLFSQIPEGALRVSTDGRTFRNSTLIPPGITALASTPDGSTLLAAAQNGIFRSADGGASWTGPQRGFAGAALALAIDPTNSSNAYGLAVLNGGGLLYRSVDGGVTWQPGVPASAYATLASRIVVDPLHPSTLYIFLVNGLVRTDDYGNTWQPVSLPAAYSPSGQATPTAFAIAPSQPQIRYAATYLSPCLKSVDGGATWQAVGTFTLPVLTNSMAIDPQDPNVVWVANGSGIQRSMDGGATFQTILKKDGASWVSLAIDPAHPSHVFATNYLQMYATLDGGSTWNVVASGMFTDLLATPLSVFVGAQVPPTSYLVKFDPTLSRILFSTFVGASAYGLHLVVDADGNPLITGVTQAIDFPTTPGALQSTFSSTSAGFATKVRADGSALLYSTFLQDFVPAGAAFDSTGKAVIVGEALGSPRTTAKAFQPATPGGCPHQLLFGQLFGGAPAGQGFAMKLSGDGSAFQWATYLAGSCGDVANAVQVDSAGNSYITGTTASPDFPVSKDAMTGTYPGLNTSGFVSELSSDGSSLLYSSFFGAGANNSGNAIALDGRGNVFIGGFTQAMPSAGALAATHVAGCQRIFFIGPSFDTSYQANDGFAMKMTLSAAPPNYIATIGGSCQDSVSSLSIDGMGNLWVSGTTASADFPTLAPIGAFGTGGGGFVAEIDPTASKLLFSTFTGTGAAVANGSAGAAVVSTSTASNTNTNTALVALVDGSQIAAVALDSIQAPVATLPPNSPYFSPPSVAPGQLLLLKGRNLGPPNRVDAKLGADGRFPFTLGGVQVLFDGIAAALVSVQGSQIECQVPFEVDGAPATNIQVEYQGQSSNTFAAKVVPQQVTILAVSNSDGTPNAASNAATVGSVVALYISGVGQTDPKGIDGGVNPGSGISPRAMPNVYANGAPLQPMFLGAAPGESTGVFQVNLQLPAPVDKSNAVGIVVSSSDFSSPATIAVYAK